MRFWDSSALVPLLLDEPRTVRARGILAEDPDMVVWWASPVECASAFSRLRREGTVSRRDEGVLVRRLEELRSRCHEMVPGDQVRTQAMRVLRLHPLRSADALQLAAAIEWVGAPSGGTLVTFDERLASAAEAEGFVVEGL
jgi:predicted nucleic acid-binding protein